MTVTLQRQLFMQTVPDTWSCSQKDQSPTLKVLQSAPSGSHYQCGGVLTDRVNHQHGQVKWPNLSHCDAVLYFVHQHCHLVRGMFWNLQSAEPYGDMVRAKHSIIHRLMDE